MILQHQDDAPAGLVLGALRSLGLTWQTVHLDRGDPLPDPASVELAVSLGSDASADETKRGWVPSEIAWLRDVDGAGAAVLGLCFGAQALAVALGGGVERAERPERGWVQIRTMAPDALAPGPWLAWHDDAILLPADAELLADNESGPQAFSTGRHLGVQFHPEVTPEIVRGWVLAERGGERDGRAERDGQAMLEAGERMFSAARENAARLFASFLGDGRVG